MVSRDDGMSIDGSIRRYELRKGSLGGSQVHCRVRGLSNYEHYPLIRFPKRSEYSIPPNPILSQ